MNISINLMKKQNGLSLVELLIAMLIGVFLLAGISSSYVNSKNSSVQRDQLSLVEDNGRLVLEVISRAIEHTGYTPVNAGVLPTQFITNGADVVAHACPDGSQNVIDTSIFPITADIATGDSLGVIFHGDDKLFSDCTGGVLPAGCRLNPPPLNNAIPESSRIYNSFFVDNATTTFRCAGSRNGTAQVIAEGVENIQYLYGVDTTGSDNLVDRYVNATDAAGLWNSVVSVQVAVLIRSLKPVKSTNSSKQYTLLDTVITSPSDKFQREVFSTTIRLRNTL